MRIAKIISIIGLLAMTVVLIFGITKGDIASEGAWIISHPWGIVSLVDLYTGFALYSVWIAYRERSLALTVLWIVLMMVLGFWAGALYMLLALNSSGGDWKKVWMGKRAYS
jgi:hypothetical protein